MKMVREPRTMASGSLPTNQGVEGKYLPAN